MVSNLIYKDIWPKACQQRFGNKHDCISIFVFILDLLEFWGNYNHYYGIFNIGSH